MRFTFLFRCLQWESDDYGNNQCFEKIFKVTAPSVEFGELMLMRLGYDVVESRPYLTKI